MTNTKEVTERIKKPANNSPQLAHEFRFLAGAVFAIDKAEKLKHKNRAGSDKADQGRYLKELEDVLNAIGAGKLPPRQWLAGFYYNTVVARIDACHERLLKSMLSTPPRKGRGKSKTDEMALKVENLLSTGPLARQHLEDVRKEVNNLKHELFGQKVSAAQQRNEPDDLRNAWAALTELLDILENSKISGYLNTNYPSLPEP